MKRLIALLSAVLVTSSASADQTLRSWTWADSGRAPRAESGRVLADGSLEIGGIGREETLPIFELAEPGVSTSTYAIAGEVRTEGLQGRGYLEMLNHFPNGGVYFSRTLGRGAMAPLEGTSNWRPFILPFFNSARDPGPARLSFGVHLPGSGHVYLRSMRLVQYAAHEDPMQAKGEWWSSRRGGVAGGVMGSVVGLLGALIGMLGGAGRARGVVFGALGTMLAIGALSLVLGTVALIKAQPYAVFYPLLGLGVIATAIPLLVTPSLRRRYEDSELRRMSALDAGS